MDSIAERIKEIRKERKLSQKEFGQKVGITGNFVCNLEKGSRNPGKPLCKMIAIEYGINEQWLLTGEGEKNFKYTKQETIAEILSKMFEENDEYISEFIFDYAKLNNRNKRKVEQLAKELYDKQFKYTEFEQLSIFANRGNE